MKNKKNGIVRRSTIILGVVLLVTALGVLLVWQGGIHTSKKRAEEYVDIINSTIPEGSGAVPTARRDNTMATLSVDGNDFIGILEMPKYGSVLPVGGQWGSVSKYPCLYDGNIYERTIKIGATTQKGQYDFFREISVGDSLLFTDMEGNLYSYSVADILYSKDAHSSTLNQKDAELTLFIKNLYAFEYIVVFCDVSD